MRQGHSLLATLFKIYLERELRKWKRKCQPMAIPIQNIYIYIFTQFCRWPGITGTWSWWHGIYGKKTKEGIWKMGLAINLEKTKYVCMGEGK